MKGWDCSGLYSKALIYQRDVDEKFVHTNNLHFVPCFTFTILAATFNLVPRHKKPMSGQELS